MEHTLFYNTELKITTSERPISECFTKLAALNLEWSVILSAHAPARADSPCPPATQRTTSTGDTCPSVLVGDTYLASKRIARQGGGAGARAIDFAQRRHIHASCVTARLVPFLKARYQLFAG